MSLLSEKSKYFGGASSFAHSHDSEDAQPLHAPQPHFAPLPGFPWPTVPFWMPTPAIETPPSPSPHDDFVPFLQAFQKSAEDDGVRAFGAQGGVWPMGRPLQESSLASLGGAPSFTGEEKVVDPVQFFEPWTDDVIYPGAPNTHHGFVGTDGCTSYEGDDEADLPSYQDVEPNITATPAITCDEASSNPVPVLAGSTPGNPDFEPELAAYPTVITWNDILGTSAPAFLPHNTDASEFGSGTDSDQSGEGCSYQCAFLPWCQRWFVVHRLLQDELENPIHQPSPTADTMCDAFDGLTAALGELECDCAYLVAHLMGEMTILRIVLGSSRSNIVALAVLLSDRLRRLDEEIQAVAGAVRHSPEDHAGSDTDKSSATFISSHAGSVYLDV